jgi:hypothetical protein
VPTGIICEEKNEGGRSLAFRFRLGHRRFRRHRFGGDDPRQKLSQQGITLLKRQHIQRFCGGILYEREGAGGWRALAVSVSPRLKRHFFSPIEMSPDA